MEIQEIDIDAIVCDVKFSKEKFFLIAIFMDYA
jgi:hypothetical protein